jgi:cbb3-type cytochrome oxidase subunit 1
MNVALLLIMMAVFSIIGYVVGLAIYFKFLAPRMERLFEWVERRQFRGKL